MIWFIKQRVNNKEKRLSFKEFENSKNKDIKEKKISKNLVGKFNKKI